MEDKTLHVSTDITSATHSILDSQGSKPFPVNVLLNTGSLGPDGNYVHKDIVKLIDPLNKYTKRPTNSICSGLNNSCIANSSYININVMLTKLFYIITIKCLILATTPFDFIIGRNKIKKHHLVNRFPDYFGLLTEKINDITIETEDNPPDLPSTKVRKVIAIQNTKSTCCTDACHCQPNDGIFIATWPSQPERSTISITSLSGDSKPLQALNLKRNLDPVKKIPHTVAAVQMFLEGHDGAPADRIYLLTDALVLRLNARICARD